MRTQLPDPACVLKVDGGRGFIISRRVVLDHSSLPKHLAAVGLKKSRSLEVRSVITAAHCLPQLPPAAAAALCYERTYQDLLGTLDGKKSGIFAESLFVDPVADIAVLGEPDHQSYFAESENYHDLIDNAPTLKVGRAATGPGWILTLKGRWRRIHLNVLRGMFGQSLEIDPTEPGMSGSPILNCEGQAVAVIVVGRETVADGQRKKERCGPHPILLRDLPARFFKRG